MAEISQVQPNFESSVMSPDMIAAAFDTATDRMARILAATTAGENTGILSVTDPTVSSTTSIAPLWVTQVEDEPLNWEVSPGVAVTTSGKFLELTDITQVSLVSVEQGAVNIVAIQATTEPLNHYVVAPNGDVVDTGTIESCRVVMLSYAAYSIMQAAATTASGDSNLSDLVVLGVVTWDTSAGPTLITSPTSTYPWIRPWFTATDVEHRSKIGTGTVSDTNPHGLSLADLQIGNMTIYDQITSSGMILSKDISTVGIPGVYCVQKFLQDAISVDGSGTLTERSQYGGIGAKYLTLSVYPNTIASIRKSGTRREMCGELIPHTNVVVLPREETIDDQIEVWYYKTDSVAVTQSTTTSMTFSNLQNGDLIITNGYALPSLNSTALQFRRYGSIPRALTMYVAQSGRIFSDPYVLAPSALVLDVQSEAQSNQIALYAPAKIGVGVCYFAATSSAYMAIRITGTNSAGDAISEVLEFRATDIAEADIGASIESATQVKYTTETMYSLASWEIITDNPYAPQGLSFSCAVTVYARTDLAKARLASVATAMWDGSSIKNTQDARRILPVVTDGEYGQTSVTQAAESIALASQISALQQNKQPMRLLCAEDFRQPKYVNITRCAWRNPKLQTPIISDIHSLSSDNVNCYKSRFIPCAFSSSLSFQVCVVLFGNDVQATKGSVRCVVRDQADVEYEATLIPYSEDAEQRTFIGSYPASMRAVSFVVSGTASGYAAFFMKNQQLDSAYALTLTQTGA